MNKRIRILYLEDRPEDVELVKDLLEREYLPCEIIWVNGREGYVSALRESWSFDLIMVDYMLPDIGGDEALELARKHAGTLPFIFLSGSLGEERAVECLRHGATDYVFKNNLPRLAPVLRRALEEARQATARRDAEAANARVAALLRATLESTAEGLLVVDLAGRISAYNRKFLALFGIPEYVMARMDLDEVIQYLTDQFEGPNALLDEVRMLRSRPEKETSGILTLNGGRSLEQSGRPQRVGSETVGRVLSVREAPAQRPDALQSAFVEGLKGLGEAILAGRVAPWLLQSDRLVIPDTGLAILGSAALPQNLSQLVNLIHPDDAECLMEALERAQNVSFRLRVRRGDGSWHWTRWNLERCAEGYRGVFMDITEQAWFQERMVQRSWREGARTVAGRVVDQLDRPQRILGEVEQTLAQIRHYAGLGPPVLVPLQPNGFLDGVLPAFRTEAGPELAIEFQPGPELPPVPMDPAQLEQAMAALLRNARQAMGGVGSVHLATGLLQARPYRPGGLPGLRKSRVWFEVRDHGPGIPVALRERIFEPLFSTRPESGCCGLGLALVRTVVDGHDGSIQVDSAADGGAVVRILIPV
jgi:hypothetical protein